MDDPIVSALVTEEDTMSGRWKEREKSKCIGDDCLISFYSKLNRLEMFTMKEGNIRDYDNITG